MQMEKRALCAFDDKRFILEDGISTLAYGHHAITAEVVDDNEASRGEMTGLHVEEAETAALIAETEEDMPIGLEPQAAAAEQRMQRALTARRAPDSSATAADLAIVEALTDLLRFPELELDMPEDEEINSTQMNFLLALAKQKMGEGRDNHEVKAKILSVIAQLRHDLIPHIDGH